MKTQLKTLREGRHRFHCPVRRPSRDIAKTQFPYFRETSIYGWFFCIAPRAQFCEFRSENLTSYLHKSRQTESESFFFQTRYGRFCIFPDLCIGHISRTKKKGWDICHCEAQKLFIQMFCFQRRAENLKFQNFLVPPLWGKREKNVCFFIYFFPTAASGAISFFWLQIVNTVIETSSCDDRRSIST